MTGVRFVRLRCGCQIEVGDRLEPLGVADDHLCEGTRVEMTLCSRHGPEHGDRCPPAAGCECMLCKMLRHAEADGHESLLRVIDYVNEQIS